ncbi:unnamed protein product [Protopolystoma xenopodis]|uniref:Uncharacterized protein n=1 Tax=Protopolystoma xenopodis TaxID=117903 RepID=A0A3S5C0H2_9PLAT|nr:unnamed protein product [Protopolystoma xenopodis]
MPDFTRPSTPLFPPHASPPQIGRLQSSHWSQQQSGLCPSLGQAWVSVYSLISAYHRSHHRLLTGLFAMPDQLASDLCLLPHPTRHPRSVCLPRGTATFREST